jgi:hypothetical protein
MHGTDEFRTDQPPPVSAEQGFTALRRRIHNDRARFPDRKPDWIANASVEEVEALLLAYDELQAAQERIAELEVLEAAWESVPGNLFDQTRDPGAGEAWREQYIARMVEAKQAQEREKLLEGVIRAAEIAGSHVSAELAKTLEREKALRKALAEVVGFAQEVQRGTTAGDAHECGKHIERIALAAQRTEEA